MHQTSTVCGPAWRYRSDRFVHSAGVPKAAWPQSGNERIPKHLVQPGLRRVAELGRRYRAAAVVRRGLAALCRQGLYAAVARLGGGPGGRGRLGGRAGAVPARAVPPAEPRSGVPRAGAAGRGLLDRRGALAGGLFRYRRGAAREAQCAARRPPPGGAAPDGLTSAVDLGQTPCHAGRLADRAARAGARPPCRPARGARAGLSRAAAGRDRGQPRAGRPAWPGELAPVPVLRHARRHAPWHGSRNAARYDRLGACLYARRASSISMGS